MFSAQVIAAVNGVSRTPRPYALRRLSVGDVDPALDPKAAPLLPRYMVYEENDDNHHFVECFVGREGDTQVAILGDLGSTPHYSGSQDFMEASLKQRGGRVKCYPANQSLLDGLGGQPPNQRAFVNVINKGTPEYQASGAEAILESIKWTELLELLLLSANENQKRGNIQLNFGYSSGRGHQPRQGAVVVDHFGAAVPAVHIGTDNPLIIDTLVACSMLAKLPALGVYWATQVGLDPVLTDRHRVFASRLCPPGAESYVELLSLVGFRIKDASGKLKSDMIQGVLKHTDKMNAGQPISQVQFSQRVVKDSKTGDLYLLGLVCNQRKSITEACVRRDIGGSVSKELVEYMIGIDNFRLPSTTVQQFVDYGIGSHGLYVSIDEETGEPVAVRLLSRPAMNKNVYFLSAVVDAIKRFAEEVADDFCLQDGVSICAMARYTGNFESILAALSSPDLLHRWAQRKLHRGGVVGLIMDLLIEWSGGLNFDGGVTRRHQPFFYKAISPVDLQTMIHGVTQMCAKSQARPIAASMESYTNCLHKIQRFITGPPRKNYVEYNRLSTQHFLHLLVDCGFLNGPGLTRFALVCRPNKKAPSRSTNGPEIRQLQLDLEAMFNVPIDLAMLENLFCECSREKEVVDLVTPGQSFFEGTGQGSAYTKLEHKIGVSHTSGGSSRLVATSTPFAGIPVCSNETYPIVGTDDIPVKADHNGNRKNYFFKAEMLGEREIDVLKELFFTARRPGETLSDYHMRVAKLVVERPIVRMLLQGKQPIVNPKEYRKGTERLQWNKAPNRNLLQALDRHNPTPVAQLPTAALPFVPTKANRKRKKRWGPRNSVLPAEPAMATIGGTTVEATALATPSPSTKPSPLPPLVTPPTATVEAPALETPSPSTKPTPVPPLVTPPPAKKPKQVHFNLGEFEATNADDLSSVSSDQLENGSNSGAMHPATLTAESDVSTGGDSNTEVEKRPTKYFRSVFAGIGESTIRFFRGNGTSHPPGEPASVPPTDTSPVTAVTAPDDTEIVTAVSPPKRSSPRFCPSFTDTDGLSKVLDWSTTNLRRSSKQVLMEGCRISSWPTGTALRNIAGYGYNTFNGARGVFDHPSPCLVATPGLLHEATKAIHSMRANMGLFTKEPNLVLRDFVFSKAYDNGRTYYYCSTSQFPVSVVYSKPGRCLLCDRLADSLGAKTVTGTGGVAVHGFESCEIATRYLCLALMFTTGTSEYLMGLLKRARRWYGRAENQHFAGKPSSSKAGESNSVEFFVVAFGRAPSIPANKDLQETMPYFYVVARYADRTKHQTYRTESLNDFVIVVPDLDFYRKHYATAECPRPKKNDFGNALYIRPIQTEEFLFNEEPQLEEPHSEESESEAADSEDEESVSPTNTAAV